MVWLSWTWTWTIVVAWAAVGVGWILPTLSVATL